MNYDFLYSEWFKTLNAMAFKSILTPVSALALAASQILASAPASLAAIPALNYTCPGKIEVYAPKGGPIYINGKEAKLKTLNNNAYEATSAGVTISLTINPDGTADMSYTGPGRSNGICSASAKTGAASAQKPGNTPENLYGSVPPKLKDLVGAKAGQAEGQLTSRGYAYKNTVTFEGGKSAYYVEKSTGYCVEVGTVDGRYSSIVYNSSDRCVK